MLSEEEVEKYIKSGKIVHITLKEAERLVKPGAKVIYICEKLEKMIIERGGKPAFPVNVSINDVAAHYSSPIGDATVIPDDGVVKIDVGAHVNGYIADAALTIPLSSKYERLAYSALKALINAQKLLKAGVNLGKIGLLIEKTIKNSGFKPIRNLTGHLITRYNLHAGKIVPNIRTLLSPKTKAGEVYAVEPFATNGYGEVVEWLEGYIYKLENIKKAKKRSEKELVKMIYKNFGPLPFSERWLTRFLPETTIKKMLPELTRKKIVKRYNVFIEKGGGYVSQFENTIIITRKGVYNTTRIEELI